MIQTRVAGSCVVITGGAGGIGSALAAAFADAGCFVHVVDVSEAAAGRVVADLEAAGGTAAAHAADVSDEGAVVELFRSFDALGQTPDILVNAAGLIKYEPLISTSGDDVRRLTEVNVVGAYLCLREAARRMADKGAGRIINIASTASFVAPRLAASAYSMTKGAIRQLTIAAAAELAPSGVLVNGVAPGTTRTDFLQGSVDTAEAEQVAAAKIPLGRIAEPEDIVGPVLFFASEASAYVTGQVLLVDGGRLTRSA